MSVKRGCLKNKCYISYSQKEAGFKKSCYISYNWKAVLDIVLCVNDIVNKYILSFVSKKISSRSATHTSKKGRKQKLHKTRN